MDIEKLPVTFLSNLVAYLNSYDLFNLVRAYQPNLVSTADQINYLTSSYLFSLLFDRNRCNLEKCFQINATEFKSLLKIFKTKKKKIDNSSSVSLSSSSDLKYLNLNFCFSIFGYGSFKSNPIVKLINIGELKSLTEFHAIHHPFKTNDLLNFLANGPSLKCVSFFLDCDVSGPRNISSTNISADTYKSIQSVKVAFRSTSSDDCIRLICQYFFNIHSLELYMISTENFELNGINFPLEKFTNLDELVMGTRNIFINFNYESMLDRSFVEKVKKFNVNLKINDANSLKVFLNKANPIRINVYTELKTSIVDDSNQYNESIDNCFSFLQNMNLNCVSWKSLTLNANQRQTIPIIREIDQIRLTFSYFLKLEKLDLGSIHIHSTESICKIISNLIHLTELSLPCCALHNQTFNKQNQKVSFKRVFEEEDENSDNLSPITNRQNSQREMNYLTEKQLKIKKFSISCPEKFKKKSNFECEIIDFVEIQEILKWIKLKSLKLENCKIIATEARFEEFMRGMSKNLDLNELLIIKLKNFLTFSYQSIFTRNLGEFKCLKVFELDFAEFSFSQTFFNSLLNITSTLNVLKLKFNSLERRLFIENMKSFNKFKNLLHLEIIIKNKESDIDFFNKNLKLFLPKWTYYRLIKEQDNQISSPINSNQLINLSNVNPKYNIEDCFFENLTRRVF